MSTSLYDSIRQIVQQELRRTRTAELAIVKEQHPHADGGDSDNYACTVTLRDTGIVLKQVPVATGRVGVASIPALGELVLVQFIGGDILAPVIIGRLYSDQHRPPPNDADQWIAHLPLDAGDDDAVHIELASGSARSLAIKLGSGVEIRLQDDDPAVTIDVGGNAKIEIARDGALQIQSASDLSIKGDADIAIEAGGKLNLKGSVVNIN